MNRFFGADYICTAGAEYIRNGVVEVDANGSILGIYDRKESIALQHPVEQLDGVITPGFVNVHSHLELSHLKGKIQQKKGLVNFVKDVMANRAADEKTIEEAMKKADQEMYDNGIVAVGDISNTVQSLNVKENSKLYYHTFVEVMGFDPEKAEKAFEDGLKIKEAFASQPTSIVPHAAYSVSKELLKLIKLYAKDHQNLFTIHNQESEEENKFFRYKKGDFLELYDHLKIDIEFFKAQARNSLQSIAPAFPDNRPVLLVHNTYTGGKDIAFARRFDRNISWCFCPSANQFVEDRIPKVELFLGQGFNITLGTDSLASNGSLSILKEMHVLQQNYEALTFDELLTWATINGAKFLKIDHQYGSIELGKKPGLNLVKGLDNWRITPKTTVQRLI